MRSSPARASSDPPPTEYDDVHVIENFPTVSLINPSNGGTVAERTFRPAVSAYARRGVSKVEYLMDGDVIGTSVYSPYDSPVTVPNRFSKGFHTFTARAYDDVGNRGESSITVNLTADEGPIGIRWNSPWYGQYVSQGSFPFDVTFTIDDPRSVRQLRVSARRFGSDEESVIGTIDAPALPSFSLRWQSAQSGRYDLIVQATLLSGDVRTESIPVQVQ